MKPPGSSLLGLGNKARDEAHDERAGSHEEEMVVEAVTRRQALKVEAEADKAESVEKASVHRRVLDVEDLGHGQYDL